MLLNMPLNTQNKNTFKTTALATALFTATIFSGNMMGQATATAPAAAKDAASKTEAAAKSGVAKVKEAPVMVSDKEIADAKAKGMVWVNTNTKVYHMDGEFYGHTKQGKFMAKADADKAGFHEAKEPVTKKKAEKTDKK
jgi:hypothetical protein